MENKYLFRGKQVDTGKWKIGYLSFVYVDGKNEKGFIYTEKARIYSPEEAESFDVWTKTIGQCTGLKDKKGKLIFEGDILEYVDAHEGSTECGFYSDEFLNIGIVEWNSDNLCYLVTNACCDQEAVFYYNDEIKIIGNIHENDIDKVLESLEI